MLVPSLKMKGRSCPPYGCWGEGERAVEKGERKKQGFISSFMLKAYTILQNYEQL